MSKHLEQDKKGTSGTQCCKVLTVHFIKGDKCSSLKKSKHFFLIKQQPGNKGNSSAIRQEVRKAVAFVFFSQDLLKHYTPAATKSSPPAYVLPDWYSHCSNPPATNEPR